MKDRNLEIYPVSAATRRGFDELMRAVVRRLKELPPIEPFYAEPLELPEVDKQSFEITLEDGVYILSGPSIDYLFNSVNFGDEDSLNYFHRTLRRWGVIDRLREMGAKEGDTVAIGEMEFDFVE